jgi:putative ABC transport system permease protein
VSFRRLVARSLRHYGRTGVLVAFGVAVAAAAITGSLLIGDSVRSSLRATALRRLGEIEYALVAPGFFRARLARGLADSRLLPSGSRSIIPLLLTRGAVRSAETEAVLPAVNVVGVEPEFWSFYRAFRRPPMSGRHVAVNAALARDLKLKPGDAVLLTISRGSAIPEDSLFARRKRGEATRTLRLTVAAVLPDGGPGGFALDAGTAVRRNLFMERDWLAAQMGWSGQANALLVKLHDGTSEKDTRDLQAALAETCDLADYGLKVAPDPERGYLSLQSAGMLLTDGQVQAAREAAKDCGARADAVSVYLASTIRRVSPSSPTLLPAYPPAPSLKGRGEERGRGEGETHRGIAYAVIAGQLHPSSFILHPFSLALNRWAADDLGARIGDRVEVAWMVPSWDGVYRTKAKRFTVQSILGMETADPGLVPTFEGITNVKRIGDWNPPFPVDLRRITPRDEAYWDRWRAAPKAFVSPEVMREIWESGSPGKKANWITSVQVSLSAGQRLASLDREFRRALLRRLAPESAGLIFRPVRQQALAAAEGTTDFGQLFMALSFFLVLSAAGLAGMLMRLSTERRASEAGLMLACGFTPGQVRRALLAEGAVLTAAGALAGVPLGVLYARFILHMLTTRWIGATGMSALWLHVSSGTLLSGLISGLAVGLLAIVWGARRLGRMPVLRLLSGWQAVAVLSLKRPGRLKAFLCAVLLLAAALIALPAGTGAIPATVAFFASGAALLTAGLLACEMLLVRVLRTRKGAPSLGFLSLRNAATHQGYSVLTVGLLAAASFLLVTIAANTRDFSQADPNRRDSGTGGFALTATASLPVSYDFGSPAGRASLRFPSEDEAAFKGMTVVPFLLSPGEDISCLNLAKATAPRLLGVRREMIERGGFTVSTRTHAANPWTLLTAPTEDGAIPAFADSETALWNLHSGPGQVYTIPGDKGQPVKLRFVGLVSRSVFAGELLISEANFRKLYPNVSGPRYFLIATPRGAEERVAEALRRNLGETGLEVQSTREILNALIGVQNTYLSTFMALGGLGLLLGTVGLATVLLRNALERRREFALMLACGFRREDVARLLVLENAGLLVAGVVLGTACALVAVAPQIRSAEAQVNTGALAGLLAGMLAVGLITCMAAGRAAVRGRLLEALRSE